MTLPSDDSPLYNHALPQIEAWLVSHGCQQDRDALHCWSLTRPTWKATLYLEEDHLTVHYLSSNAESGDGENEAVQRSFKYSLSRKDIEDAIFAGP